jgi:hypothetical protein
VPAPWATAWSASVRIHAAAQPAPPVRLHSRDPVHHRGLAAESRLSLGRRLAHRVPHMDMEHPADTFDGHGVSLGCLP